MSGFDTPPWPRVSRGTAHRLEVATAAAPSWAHGPHGATGHRPLHSPTRSRTPTGGRSPAPTPTGPHCGESCFRCCAWRSRRPSREGRPGCWPSPPTGLGRGTAPRPLAPALASGGCGAAPCWTRALPTTAGLCSLQGAAGMTQQQQQQSPLLLSRRLCRALPWTCARAGACWRSTATATRGCSLARSGAPCGWAPAPAGRRRAWAPPQVFRRSPHRPTGSRSSLCHRRRTRRRHSSKSSTPCLSTCCCSRRNTLSRGHWWATALWPCSVGLPRAVVRGPHGCSPVRRGGGGTGRQQAACCGSRRLCVAG